MRYFSSNITEVIAINAFSDYRPSTAVGVENLWHVAESLRVYFERPTSVVVAELIRALEHGRNGKDGYTKATALPSAEADAMWTVARVIFGTFNSGAIRGVGRRQGVVVDLNRGICILMIHSLDYEGMMVDNELTTTAGTRRY